MVHAIIAAQFLSTYSICIYEVLLVRAKVSPLTIANILVEMLLRRSLVKKLMMRMRVAASAAAILPLDDLLLLHPPLLLTLQVNGQEGIGMGMT